MPISRTRILTAYVLAILCITSLIFYGSKLNNHPVLGAFSNLNSQTKETSMGNSSNSLPLPLRYGVVFPEGSDMDFSFVIESLQKNPNIQFYPYPFKSPQKNLLSLPINRIPLNKGNEAMVFLSFIIQHYDRLPEKILFVHGHQGSWHQNSKLVDIITHLKWEKIDTYLSINNCGGHQFINTTIEQLDKRESEYVGDENLNGGGHEQKAFESFLKQLNFSRYGLEIDQRINHPGCCAQFVVTKDDIRRNPIKLYEDLREWLINTKMPDYYSGRMFEYSWHWYFTRAPKFDRRPECKNLFEGYIEG